MGWIYLYDHCKNPLYSMIRRYLSCIFHHPLIFWGVYYPLFIIHIFTSIFQYYAELSFCCSLPITKLKNLEIWILKYSYKFERKYMDVGEHRVWEILESIAIEFFHSWMLEKLWINAPGCSPTTYRRLDSYCTHR